MPTTPTDIQEAHARHIGSATLIIDTDGSWLIGPTRDSGVKVAFGEISTITDATFGWSAVAVEDGYDYYRLFVRNDADRNLIVEVAVDAEGSVDPASLKILSPGQVDEAETLYGIDLNRSGSFGADSVLLHGGAANVYMDERGFYTVGDGDAAATPLLLGGAPLDDTLLPAGWQIVKALPRSDGWDVFAQDPSGVIFDARFDSGGHFTGGNAFAGTALDSLERSLGVDLDGNG